MIINLELTFEHLAYEKDITILKDLVYEGARSEDAFVDCIVHAKQRMKYTWISVGSCHDPLMIDGWMDE